LGDVAVELYPLEGSVLQYDTRLGFFVPDPAAAF
jgi:hypothetical protein